MVLNAHTNIDYNLFVKITIFTDGSSLGNPGPGGFCAIIKIGSQKKIVKGGDKYTTNNRMEMSAIIAGLYAVTKWFPKIKTCSVYSDSNLLIESLNKGWKRKKNLDLWTKLDTVIGKFDKIVWQWIRGHADNSDNIEADRIANFEARKRKQIKLQKVRSI